MTAIEYLVVVLSVVGPLSALLMLVESIRRRRKPKDEPFYSSECIPPDGVKHDYRAEDDGANRW